MGFNGSTAEACLKPESLERACLNSRLCGVSLGREAAHLRGQESHRNSRSLQQPDGFGTFSSCLHEDGKDPRCRGKNLAVALVMGRREGSCGRARNACRMTLATSDGIDLGQTKPLCTECLRFPLSNGGGQQCLMSRVVRVQWSHH